MEPERTPEEERQYLAAENQRLEQEAEALAERRLRLENLVLRQAALIERLEANLLLRSTHA